MIIETLIQQWFVKKYVFFYSSSNGTNQSDHLLIGIKTLFNTCYKSNARQFGVCGRVYMNIFCVWSDHLFEEQKNKANRK